MTTAALLAQIRDLTAKTLRTSRALADVPVFDDKRESFRTFLQRFNDYVNAHNYEDEDAKRILPLSLRGAARDAFENLPRATKAADFKDLVIALQDAICTDELRLIARAELNTLRQDGKTVEVFARACMETATRAYPTVAESATRNAILLSSFVNGLRADLRAHVRRSRPATFEEARTAALHEETIAGLDRAEDSAALRTAINQLTEQINFLSTNREAERQPARESQPWSRDRRGPANRENWGSDQPWRNGNNSRGRNFRGNFNRTVHWENRRNPEYRDRTDSPFRRNNRDRDYSPFRRDNRSFERRRSPSARDSGAERNRNGRGNRNGNRRNRNYRQEHTVASVFDPSRAPSPSGSLVNTLFIVTALACLLTAVDATPNPRTYYHCQEATGGILVVPPKPTACIQPNATEIQAVRVSMYIRNTSLLEIPATRCTIKTFKFCTDTLLWWTTQNISTIKYSSPEANECRVAFRERRWRELYIKGTKPFVYETEFGNPYPQVGWKGEDCVTKDGLLIETSTLTKLDDGTIITPLLVNTQSCQIEDGECSSESATVVWEPPKALDSCNYISVGEFEGIVGDDILIIESMESAFHLEPETPHGAARRCFNGTVRETKGGPLFVIRPTVEQATNRPKRSSNRRSIGYIFNIAPSGHYNYLHLRTQTPSLGAGLAKKIEEARVFNKTVTLFDVSPTVAGEALIFWDIVAEDVEARLRWYEYDKLEDALIDVILERETLLTMFVILGNKNEQELIDLFTPASKKIGARIEFPKEPEAQVFLLIQMALKAIGPEEQHPQIAMDGHIAALTNRNVPKRLNTPRKSLQMHSLLLGGSTTLTMARHNFVATAENIDMHRLNASVANVQPVTKWYRRLLVTMDEPKATTSTSTTPPTTTTSTTAPTTSTSTTASTTASSTTTSTSSTSTTASTTSTSTTASTTTTSTTAPPTSISTSTSTSSTPTTPSTTSTSTTPSATSTSKPSSITEPPASASTTTSTPMPTTSEEVTTSMETLDTAVATETSALSSSKQESASLTASGTHFLAKASHGRSIRSTQTTAMPDSSVGTEAHINFLKTLYDHAEEIRRNLTATHMNHKMQFLAERVQEDMRRNFNRVFNSICQIQNRQLQTWWALLRIDPTIGMRTIMDRDDVVAHFVGPTVLSLTQCRKISVTKVFGDHKVNDTCYVHTPVLTNQNITMFAVPGTLDVITHSPEVDCTTAPGLLPPSRPVQMDPRSGPHSDSGPNNR